MNPAKAFAGIFGAVYLVVGFVGFAVTGTSMETHSLLVFDLNVVHNIVHLAIGALGLLAFGAGLQASRMYALGLAVVYAVTAVAGLAVPGQFLGIIPIGGADIVLHSATAVVALAAFMVSDPQKSRARR